MEHDIPFGNSSRENGTTFLDFPLFLGIFLWDEPTKRVPSTAEPEIPEIFTKWKAPVYGTGFLLDRILRACARCSPAWAHSTSKSGSYNGDQWSFLDWKTADSSNAKVTQMHKT